MKTPALACLLVAFLVAVPLSNYAQTETKPSMEELVERLEKRIDELEKHFAPLLEAEEREEIVEVQRLRARLRMRDDKKLYNDAQLSEISQLYAEAMRQQTPPEKKTKLLQKIVSDFPKANRAGCAVQYLGQEAKGEKRIQYFKQAIANHGDCYYGDGVQVGPYARYYLANTYLEAGQKDQARPVLEEILQDYPEAINHQGHLLAPKVRAMLKVLDTN